jgi:GT2 family glycosyltransferase
MIRDATTAVTLSVVVAASNSMADLEPCLASLKGQGEAPDTEILVVCNYGAGSEERLTSAFPFARFAFLPGTTTVPELRAHGIALSTGSIVALLEDNCVVDTRWCAELKHGHASAYCVVGGAVEKSGDISSVNWAVYFYEYGKYMLPCTGGLTDSLAGNNVSYKRALLSRVAPEFQDGFFEAFIHQRLHKQGVPLYLLPTAVIYHTKQYRAQAVLAECFFHGRHYAGRRAASESVITRALLLGGSTLLPLILPLRIVRRVLQKRRHVRELCRSFPYLILFMSSWACGEFAGYLSGEGDSVRRWT